ncbi:MAG: hypothetical protein R6V06_10710 [Kiritimatiellia bacterium]
MDYISKMKYLMYAVFFTLIMSSCSLTDASKAIHPVMISHPGVNDGKISEFSLVQFMDVDGAPLEYCLDVDSVNCGDDRCEVIKVRIFWNALGAYRRLEFPGGGELTKNGHQVFSEDDYDKLNRILADKNSALKTFNPGSLAAAGRADDVDALTAPTPLFYQTSVVRGAVFTSYTLWHWVNGNITEQIRSVTAQSCKHEHLMRYVNNASVDLFNFALEQFAQRGNFENDVISSVEKRMESESAEFSESALDYLETAVAAGRKDVYCKTLPALFGKGSSRKRILCLRSLADVQENMPGWFYDEMALYLPELDSFFEVHLLLSILEKQNPDSRYTVSAALKVLSDENFLIARRAYSFLEKQKLDKQQTAMVKDFRTEFKDRL